ncbi:helix-turn-helix domain-containing protein [Lachnospiraceae bacterium 45-W7]
MDRHKTNEGSRTAPALTTYEKRVYTVDEIQSILGISKTAAYNLVKQGCFHCIKIGRNYRISKKSFDRWLGFQREVQADE